MLTQLFDILTGVHIGSLPEFAGLVLLPHCARERQLGGTPETCLDDSAGHCRLVAGRSAATHDNLSFSSEENNKTRNLQVASTHPR